MIVQESFDSSDSLSGNFYHEVYNLLWRFSFCFPGRDSVFSFEYFGEHSFCKLSVWLIYLTLWSLVMFRTVIQNECFFLINWLFKFETADSKSISKTFFQVFLYKHYAAEQETRPWILFTEYKKCPFRFFINLDSLFGGPQPELSKYLSFISAIQCVFFCWV